MKALNITKTIKGRTTLLIGSFMVILLSFSFYVYLQASLIKNDFKLYQTKWHIVQIHFFAQPSSFTSIQSGTLENIYFQNPDTAGYDKLRIEDVNFIQTNYYAYLDSVDTDWDYKPTFEKFKDFFNCMHGAKIKIAKRIMYLKSQNKQHEIISDSIIRNEYNKNIKGSLTSYWDDYFLKTLIKISDATEGISNNVRDRINKLVWTVVIFSVLLSMFYLYLWFTFIKSLKNSLNKPIKILEKLADGELVSTAEQTENELSSVIDATLKLSTNLKKASDFSREIGKGNFDHSFEAISKNDELGNSLILMRNELKTYAEKEKEINWSNIGLAKFSEIMRKSDQSIEEMSYTILTQLIKYINANQGGIFVFNAEKNVLDMTACYAYDRKKFLEKSIEVGEGLIGQCYIEADKIYLNDIPKTYISITSGLGADTPNVLLLVPIKTTDYVVGVIEIASFKSLKDFEIEFIEKIAENIAIVITNLSKNELTKKLLEDSNIATENLKMQEEEMRQNMEELFATQEEMKRRENNFLNEIEQLKTSLGKYESV